MRVHQDAAVARLKAVAVTDRVYAPNAVPVSPVTPYYVLTCDTGAAGAYRTGGRTTTQRFTVAVQCMGKTYGEATDGLERTDAAFEAYTLTVPGFDCTIARRQVAASPYRDPDGGSLLVGLHAYAFMSSPA
ncbi:MAG: hypothetical protein LH630_05050 [Actinomycetia bacterium]|nr:hypothetical protein [Actinomycetes bacterium]